MKPDWDKLADELASSSNVIVADVDCTGAGEPLCNRFGVEGFPTIKSFSPPDTEGEDYEGDRDYGAMREHAVRLGPACSAVSKENCGEEQLAELEAVMAKPAADLTEELNTLNEKLQTAEATHEELLKSLQAQFEASQEALDKLKKEVKPRTKLLRAATATLTVQGTPAKDEM